MSKRNPIFWVAPEPEVQIPRTKFDSTLDLFQRRLYTVQHRKDVTWLVLELDSMLTLLSVYKEYPTEYVGNWKLVNADARRICRFIERNFYLINDIIGKGSINVTGKEKQFVKAFKNLSDAGFALPRSGQNELMIWKLKYVQP